MMRIPDIENLLSQLNHFQANQTKPRPLEAVDDLTDYLFSKTVWFDENNGALCHVFIIAYTIHFLKRLSLDRKLDHSQGTYMAHQKEISSLFPIF